MNLLKFNIRVYGLLFNEDRVLLTDEIRYGTRMTKFPGGGLELGEGIADGLKREFMEELGIKIDVKELIYVNDFLQVSSFKKSDQIISFYYKVETDDFSFDVSSEPFDFKTDEPQCFRWVKLSDLEKESITFPIDQKVVNLL